jgi:peptidyl-prolyl cis-trans isomerase SurA
MIRNILYILSFLIVFVNNLSASDKIKIIAKVNNQVITNIDLNERYKLSKFLSKIDITSKLQKKIIRDKLLQQIIEEKLQIIDINQQHLDQDNNLDQNIDQIIINNHGNLINFQETMQKENISYDSYREQIKNKILFNKLVEKNISSKIQVTNSDINEVLEINDIKNTIESFKILEIYIEKSDDSWKIAQTLFVELQGGKDFRKLSREFSDLHDYISSEEVGWIKEGELNVKLYQSIINLSKGEISKPTELNGSYYIFKIIDKKEIPNTDIDNLQKIEDIIFKRKLSIAIRSYISDLRKNSNIVIF